MHGRALGNLWLIYWLIIPVMRHARAFSKMESFRGFFDSFHSHIFELSSKILHGSKKDLRKILFFISTPRKRGFTLVFIVIYLIKFIFSSLYIALLSINKRPFFFRRYIGFLECTGCANMML